MLVPKLRFKEFTDEWQILKLSDIAFLTSSKRIYLSDYKNFGIPFYRGKEISELKKGKKISDLLYIDEVKYEEIKNKYGIPMKNDILITAVGTLANIYRIPNNEKFYFKDGNLIWLKDIKCNSSFLEYQLEYNKKKLLDSCIGSTQKALTIVGLNKINFNIPNEKEQEKISLIIALINKKIMLQEQKIEVLKLYSESTKKILFSDSKSWEYKKIKEIIKYERPDKYIVKSTEYSNKFDIPVLTANKGFILGYTNEKDNIYKNNSIIFDDFTMDMKYVNFPFKIKSSAIKILTSNNNLLFLYESIKNLKLVSSEHKRHYIEYVQELDIPIPSLEKQEKIAKIINCFNQKILNENKKIEQLNNLKNGLMQSMFV